jgi:hypothetical protein
MADKVTNSAASINKLHLDYTEATPQRKLEIASVIWVPVVRTEWNYKLSAPEYDSRTHCLSFKATLKINYSSTPA